MRINFRLVGLFIFILAIAYLAGAYFGSYLRVIYIFFIILPAVSVVTAIAGALSLDFTQTFSTDRPVKGSSLEYVVSVRNRLFLPVVNVAGGFTSRRPGGEDRREDLFMSLPAKGYAERRFLYDCPYCGTYELDYEKFKVRDLLTFLTINRTMPDNSIFVYPRILPIDSFSSVVEDIRGEGSTQSPDGMADNSLFLQLREYRDGESIRHMSWKKYASTGKPFLKDYDKTRKMGVRIYLDLRRDFTNRIDRLEQQDISLEVVVALVKYFLERNVEVQVSSAGYTAYSFEGRNALQFAEFYEGTPELKFSERVSPIDRVRKDDSEGDLSQYAVIILTHMNDQEIFSYPDKTGNTDIKVIANIGGRRNTGEDLDYLKTLGNHHKGEFYVVEESESIKGILENHVYSGS